VVQEDFSPRSLLSLVFKVEGLMIWAAKTAIPCMQISIEDWQDNVEKGKKDPIDYTMIQEKVSMNQIPASGTILSAVCCEIPSANFSVGLETLAMDFKNEVQLHPGDRPSFSFAWPCSLGH
jgi:hypothetical protein